MVRIMRLQIIAAKIRIPCFLFIKQPYKYTHSRRETAED